VKQLWRNLEASYGAWQERRANGRERAVIANAKRAGILRWTLRLYAFAFIILVMVAALWSVDIYGDVRADAPPTPKLENYAGGYIPKVTRVYANDGTLLARYIKEWREFLPLHRMPKKLIDAFLAVEDHQFYDHGGLYFRGILRAAWRNVTAGDWVQGGSTITQQVAKQFMDRRRTLRSKALEALVARQLESHYTKDEILSVYLNQIFLGAGAHGVQAAAKRYFSKDVKQLNVAEAAMLAGLAQAPSAYSPLSRRKNARARALARRNVVLDKMARYGYIDQAKADKWKATPIELHPFHTRITMGRYPYYTEHVRRYLMKKYKKKRVFTAGLTVETALQPFADGVAYENVDFSARKQDKRQGWRGPVASVQGDQRSLFLSRAEAMYGDAPLAPHKRYLALVEAVKYNRATVRVGKRSYNLRRKRMDWAARWSIKDYTNDKKLYNVKHALKVGDIVWVSRPVSHVRKFTDWDVEYKPKKKKDGTESKKKKPDARWKKPQDLKVDADQVQLEQTPHPQAAMLSFDWHTGYVHAMVGGNDYARSQFNRAIQACRQPGSTYKPIYYSLALNSGYSFGTALNDEAKVEDVDEEGRAWKPENLEGETSDEDPTTSMETALIWSKNVPSVDLFKDLGGKNVEKWARKLGFTSKIIPDKALALGASCAHINEMSRAFAIFARNGRWLDLVYVRRILDHAGNVVEDHTHAADPMLSPAARLDRLVVTAGSQPRQAIPPRPAYLITKLLRKVVKYGHEQNIRRLKIRAAGKTGTSSATMDMWFIAFTDRWMTTTWLGDDERVRPLGAQDASYFTSVMFWGRFMHEALNGRPTGKIPVAVPPGVDPNDEGGHRSATTSVKERRKENHKRHRKQAEDKEQGAT